MDSKNNIISPSTDEELWASPTDIFTDQINQKKGPMMSTPNLTTWKSFSTSLGDSGSSSWQDSGYCSFTPSSSTPFREDLLTERCQWCSDLSPSHSICNCKKKYLPKKLSTNLECLQTISETKSVPSSLFLSKDMRNGGCDLFSEAMDTSFYPEELELVSQQSDSQGCLVNQMEIDEERSIDFMDDTVNISKNISSGIKRNKDGQTIHEECQVGKKSGQIPLVGSAFMTPNKGNKPAIENQKRDTGTNFLSVAKQIFAMNRVVKSFSLNGIEKVDILDHLINVRFYCPNIVQKIFGFLSEKDLNSVSMVSKTWNDILSKDYLAYNRWKLYKTTMTLRKENLSSPTKECSSSRLTRVGPLSPLQSIQNVRPQRPGSSSSPRISPPVSPQSARFRSFQKAAKLLKKGERLLPCPRCFFPSHDHGSPTLQCSRSGCRHRFCVWCRNEIITGVSHDCPPRYTPKFQCNSSYKMAAVGSKSCKRKLRRLALD